jgi:hypothetical protein
VRVFEVNQINFLDGDEFLQLNVAVRFGFKRVKLGVSDLNVLSFFKLITAYQVGTVDSFVADWTKVAVTQPRSALGMEQMKRNVRVLDRGMNFDRDGYQAKG